MEKTLGCLKAFLASLQLFYCLHLQSWLQAAILAQTRDEELVIVSAAVALSQELQILCTFSPCSLFNGACEGQGVLPRPQV